MLQRPYQYCYHYAVHPHACGADDLENFRAAGWARFIPTRVGQMADVRYQTENRVRFIPTRVGQMRLNGIQKCIVFGSSPRVWGRLKMRIDYIR